MRSVRGNRKQKPGLVMLALVLALLYTALAATAVGAAGGEIACGVTASLGALRETSYYAVRASQSGRLAIDLHLGNGSQGAMVIVYDAAGNVAGSGQRMGSGSLKVTVRENVSKGQVLRIAVMPLGAMNGTIKCNVSQPFLFSIRGAAGPLPFWTYSALGAGLVVVLIGIWWQRWDRMMA